MKILFYTRDVTACRYFRVELPFKYLSKDPDIHTEVTPTLLPQHFTDWDVVVFQKNVQKKDTALIKKVQASGGKVVYEADDDYFNIPPWNTGALVGYRHVRNGIEEILRTVDAVTVTTQHLADQYKRYNSKIFVLPNSIDISLVSKIESGAFIPTITDGFGKLVSYADYKKRTEGKLVIGYYGSATHYGDLKLAVRPIGKFLNRSDSVFTFVGNLPNELRWAIPKEKLFTVHPVILDNYMKMLKSLEFDVTICPIQDISFNRSKSNLKVIESMSLGSVPVTSKVGEYIKTITHGQTGFLCSSTDDWIAAFSSLQNEGTRQRMQQNCKRYVSDNYDIVKTVDLWKQAYRTVAGGKTKLIKPVKQSEASLPSFWNKVWKEEGFSTWRVYPELYEFVASKVPTGSKVLDVGCGPGKFSFHILDKVDVDHMDFASEVKNLVPNLTVKDITSYSGAGEYSCVVCLEVLQYVTDVQKAVANLVSFLSPRGKLIISVPNNSMGLDYDAIPAWKFTRDQLESLLQSYCRTVDTYFVSEHLVAICGR